MNADGLHEFPVKLELTPGQIQFTRKRASRLAGTPGCRDLQTFKTRFSLSSKNKKKYQQIVAEKTAQAAGKSGRKRFHQKSKPKKQ